MQPSKQHRCKAFLTAQLMCEPCCCMTLASSEYEHIAQRRLQRWKQQAGIPNISMLRAGCARGTESVQLQQGRSGCRDLHKIWVSWYLATVTKTLMMLVPKPSPEVMYRWLCRRLSVSIRLQTLHVQQPHVHCHHTMSCLIDACPATGLHADCLLGFQVALAPL